MGAEWRQRDFPERKQFRPVYRAIRWRCRRRTSADASIPDLTSLLAGGLRNRTNAEAEPL